MSAEPQQLFDSKQLFSNIFAAITSFLQFFTIVWVGQTTKKTKKQEKGCVSRQFIWLGQTTKKQEKGCVSLQCTIIFFNKNISNIICCY